MDCRTVDGSRKRRVNGTSTKRQWYAFYRSLRWRRHFWDVPIDLKMFRTFAQVAVY